MNQQDLNLMMPDEIYHTHIYGTTQTPNTTMDNNINNIYQVIDQVIDPYGQIGHVGQMIQPNLQPNQSWYDSDL